MAQAPCPALLRSEPRAKLALSREKFGQGQGKKGQPFQENPENFSELSDGRLVPHVVDF